MDRDDFTDWATAATPRLLRVGRLLVADAQGGEDLVQEVLERIYLRWNRVQDPDGYAYRALANAAASRWRWRSRHREEALPGGTDSAVPADFTRAVDDRDEALAILSRLPARQRAVLVLRYLEDRSEQDVADLLDIGVGTVKSHTARALSTLRSTGVPAAAGDTSRQGHHSRDGA